MRAALVGTGLIGASLGMALLRSDEVTSISGYDRNADELQTALERGAITDMATDARQAVTGADLVILAVPVSAMGPVMRDIAPSLREGAIVTDVASVKSEAVRVLEAAAPAGVHVIGGHPMAGSHEHGAEHACADLFVGATYLLTPTQQTDSAAYSTVHQLVVDIKARPLAVDPDHHDQLVAIISHLPQLAATTLMNLASERAQAEHAGLLLLAAGGFRDATRVAASNPDLWLDICDQNGAAITAVLDEYGNRIADLRDAIAGKDWKGVCSRLSAARTARQGMPGKESVTGALVELVLPIPDRPGVLAEVTTSVGSIGVNIEDLGIEHAPEGGGGRLRLAIIGTAEAERAVAILVDRGYEVLREEL
ncbi:MAG: prephenate dehydrogenase/arogenate dehydrogenase family protein [Euzebya sp.]